MDCLLLSICAEYYLIFTWFCANLHIDCHVFFCESKSLLMINLVYFSFIFVTMLLYFSNEPELHEVIVHWYSKLMPRRWALGLTNNRQIRPAQIVSTRSSIGWNSRWTTPCSCLRMNRNVRKVSYALLIGDFLFVCNYIIITFDEEVNLLCLFICI